MSAVRSRKPEQELETELIGKKESAEFHYRRQYTRPGPHPYDLIKWENRDASIIDHQGNIIFEQKGVEVPSFWTQTATNIVASKYFRGKLGNPEREHSARQLIDRVAKTISEWVAKEDILQMNKKHQLSRPNSPT